MDYELSGESGKELKPASVQRFHANLKTALDFAISKELVEFNAARMVKAPRAKQYEAKCLSIEQIGDLWKACKGTNIEAAVFLASIYGFRRGEVCGLKWDCVDFDKRYIRIIETRTRARMDLIKGTKNRASKRTMPLLQAVSNYLTNLSERQKLQKQFCGNTWINSGYVVVDELGQPLSFSTLQKNFKKILLNNDLPDVRFHDLRHSVATYLLQIGIPIEEVSAWL